MVKTKRNNLKTLGEYIPEPVVALTKEGVFMQEFPSCAQADGILGLCPGSVAGILSGRGISATKDKIIFISKSKYNPEIKVTYASLKRKRDFLNSYK